MKIAFISIRQPSLGSGGDSRNYYLFEELSKRYPVELLIPTINNPEEIKKEGIVFLLKKLIAIFRGKIPYIERLKKAEFSQSTFEELKKFDVIQIQEISSYYFFEKYLKYTKAKIILDTHNIDYVRFLGEIKTKNLFKKYISNLYAQRLQKSEINVVKKIDSLLVCSSEEKNYFKKYIPSEKISIIPNGAIVPTYKKPNLLKNNILFMGLLGYQPNAEGLKFYIEKVHSIVLKILPDAQLIILGKEAPSWLKEVANTTPGILLKGFVPSVKRYINAANVCICPILSGSGTRLKVLEYMAMGRIVVSTTVGAEGIEVTNKKDILLADDPRDFANNIIQSLTNESLNKRIGLNARKLILQKYDWGEIGSRLAVIYKRLER